MEDILKLRFSKQDKIFFEKLLGVKSKMNARGMLNSSETVKHSHAVLVEELTNSRITIVSTISEYLTINKPYHVNSMLYKNAILWLRNRKDYLEKIYLENIKSIISNLQNKKMVSPYLNLSKDMELNEKEIEIELAQLINTYTNSRGLTLFDRVKNLFLDRPFIVISVIAITVATAILTFLKLFKSF